MFYIFGMNIVEAVYLPVFYSPTFFQTTNSLSGQTDVVELFLLFTKFINHNFE